MITRQSGLRARFDPHGVRVGWRILCQNGEPYDVFWGSVSPEKLDLLLANLRREQGPYVLLDLRDRAEDVRDKEYVDKASREAKEGCGRGVTPQG